MYVIPKVVAVAKSGTKTVQFTLYQPGPSSPPVNPPTAMIPANLTGPFPVPILQPTMTVADILPTLQDIFPNCKFSSEETWTQENAYTKKCSVTLTIDWS